MDDITMETNHITPHIIDLEASGFGRGSYPIEVGLALADGSTHCYLIKPHPRWTHWDKHSEKVHGIRREILHRHGLEVREVAAQLNRLLHGQTVYSDGWAFDSSWLALLYETAGLHQAFKIAQLQTLFTPRQYETWHRTHQQLAKELNLKRHRASSDAYLIQQTFLRSAG